MAELKPTPARLKLVQAIFDGAVTQTPTGDIRVDCIGAGWDLAGSRYVGVKARARELCRAGWADCGPRLMGSWREWALTDAGRAVLEAHRD